VRLISKLTKQDLQIEDNFGGVIKQTFNGWCDAIFLDDKDAD